MDDKIISERAAVLGKWLWTLFWLVIPVTLAGIMTSENVRNVSPNV